MPISHTQKESKRKSVIKKNKNVLMMTCFEERNPIYLTITSFHKHCEYLPFKKNQKEKL